MIFMVDTDVLIWVLRRRQPSLDWLERLAGQGTLACSVLTISEILRRGETRRTSTHSRITGGLGQCSCHL